VTQEAEDQ